MHIRLSLKVLARLEYARQVVRITQFTIATFIGFLMIGRLSVNHAVAMFAVACVFLSVALGALNCILEYVVDHVGMVACAVLHPIKGTVTQFARSPARHHTVVVADGRDTRIQYATSYTHLHECFKDASPDAYMIMFDDVREHPAAWTSLA